MNSIKHEMVLVRNQLQKHYASLHVSYYNFQSLRDILQQYVPRGFFLFHQNSGKSRTVFQIPENKYSYKQSKQKVSIQ